MAAIVTVAVYKVLGASKLDGVKIAPFPMQLTVPVTEAPPGPVTVKVFAGE
jgi:hypothetical protein